MPQPTKPKPFDQPITTASTWKYPEYIAELPSGNVARLRPLNLAQCVLNGTVPNPLLGIVNKLIGQETDVIDQVQKEDPKKLILLMNWIVCQVMVEPVAWDGEGEQPEGTISHDQIPDDDRTFVTAFAFRGVNALGKFRKE